jgi:hypothetical protein
VGALHARKRYRATSTRLDAASHPQDFGTFFANGSAASIFSRLDSAVISVELYQAVHPAADKSHAAPAGQLACHRLSVRPSSAQEVAKTRRAECTELRLRAPG